MNVNITEYEMFIAIVSNSTLQLTFKKIPVKCWHDIKNFQHYVLSILNQSFLFQLIFETKLSLFTSIRTN